MDPQCVAQEQCLQKCIWPVLKRAVPSSLDWSHRHTGRKQFRQFFPEHCYKQFQWQWLLYQRLQDNRAKAMYSKSASSARESNRVNDLASRSHDRLQHPPKFKRDPLSMSCKLQQQMGSIMHLHMGSQAQAILTIQTIVDRTQEPRKGHHPKRRGQSRTSSHQETRQ